MEEQIRRAVRNLNISYVFFWVLPAFLLGAGEFELFPVGGLVDNAPAIYYFETVGILLTALCVPLSLKLFSLVLKKKIDHMTITLALKRYVQWNIVRLGVLEVAIVVNLLCYYLTLSSTGNLCMLIGLTASLFCLPDDDPDLFKLTMSEVFPSRQLVVGYNDKLPISEAAKYFIESLNEDK